MPHTAIARDVAHRLAEIGHRQGIDATRILDRVGIGHVNGDPRGPVSIDQVAALTQELWVLTGDELFGLGEPAPLGSFAVMMRSSLHVPDLRAFLVRISDASTVILGMPHLVVNETDAVVTIQFDLDGFGDSRDFVGEILSVLIHRVLSWVTAARIPLLSVELAWPEPDYASSYEVIFGVHPVFQASSMRLDIAPSLMTLPIVRGESDLDAFLLDQPRVWYAVRDYEASVSQRVRTLLKQGLHGTWLGPEEIATRLSISPQHLRRLLRAESSSIGSIKQDVLRNAAIASIRRGDETQEELAERLGFSEASAFRRAFRRWTGQSPSSYRTLEGTTRST